MNYRIRLIIAVLLMSMILGPALIGPAVASQLNTAGPAYLVADEDEGDYGGTYDDSGDNSGDYQWDYEGGDEDVAPAPDDSGDAGADDMGE